MSTGNVSIKTGSDALMYFNQPDFASYQAFMILKKEHEDLKKEFDALKKQVNGE